MAVAHILPTPTRYKFHSHPISFARGSISLFLVTPALTCPLLLPCL